MIEGDRHAKYSGQMISMEQGGGFESLMTNESPYEKNSITQMIFRTRGPQPWRNIEYFPFVEVEREKSYKEMVP